MSIEDMKAIAEWHRIIKAYMKLVKLEEKT